MKTLTTCAPHSDYSARFEILARFGFARGPEGWRRDGILFRPDGAWVSFEQSWPETADPLSAHLGRPGLWKPMGVRGEMRSVFAVQDELVRACEAVRSTAERGVFECVVEWALATAAGVTPPGWTAPARASLEAGLPQDRLTLVHKSFMRQVQVVQAPSGLALRLAILPAVPATLLEAPQQWLRALLLEEQNGHHLFRLGFVREAGQSSLGAELDLTGVPSALLEPMLSIGLDALRWVATRLFEPATFLTQPNRASRALETCAVPEPHPSRGTNYEHDSIRNRWCDSHPFAESSHRQFHGE